MKYYRVEQVRPADPNAYSPGGPHILDPDGEGAAISGPPGLGRVDTLEGTVAGVPEAVKDRFEGKVFSERDLRHMGARRIPLAWLIEQQGTDYVLEVTEQG